MRKKLLVIGGAGILLDQITKIIIVSNLVLLKSVTIIENFFQLTYVQNTGGAWGILSDNLLFLIILTILFLVMFFLYIKHEPIKNNWQLISLGFILGGVIGNLIDRIVRGYVIDFLDFTILGYNYPVFNIADILIVAGIIMMIIEIIKGDKDEIKKRSRKQKN